jgi:hypothetical protein
MGCGSVSGMIMSVMVCRYDRLVPMVGGIIMLVSARTGLVFGFIDI